MAVTTIYHQDSFDTYSDPTLVYETVTGSLSLSGSYARGGSGQGIRTITTGSTGSPANQTNNLIKSLSGNIATAVSVAFGWRVTDTFSPGGANTKRIIVFRDLTTDLLRLCVNSSGQLFVENGSGTTLGSSGTVLVVGTFYHLEIKAVIHNTTGSVEVKLNGTTIIGPLTNQNTRGGGANNYTNRISLGSTGGLGTGGNTMTMNFDDLIISDDFIGDKRVSVCSPDGAGASTQFTPLSGSNYAQVNETLADGDTSYVSSSTPNDVDSYSMSDINSQVTGIVAVCPFAFAAKDDAGSRTFKVGVKSSSATQDSATFTLLLNTYFRYSEAFLVDPNTAAAWNAAAVNAAEARIKEIA